MAVYEFDPNRFGINFLNEGLGGLTSGIVSGSLLRQDPRNIEIRRTWSDPSKHVTPFGFAPGAPSYVTQNFDVIGGFIPATDAAGKPVINPATGQQVMKWDQTYIRKGTPLPQGYKLLNDPYKQFPGEKAKTTLPPLLGMAGMPPVSAPLRMKKGGMVVGSNPLQALITLLEIEHGKKGKEEVPAILHKGEGVVTKDGMKVLDKMVGGIDSLNAMGKKLPKMKEGGEVGKSKKSDKESSWELMKSPDGKMVWVQTKGKEGQTYPWEPYVAPQHTSGETYFMPWDPVNRQPQQYYQNPQYNPEQFLGWGTVNKYGGIGPETSPQPYAYDAVTGGPPLGKTVEATPTTEPMNTQKVEKKAPTKNIPVQPVAMTQPAVPGYRGWNAPSQFSFGQLQGMNPLQALGIIQADVESRGGPGLQPVYGAQGNVLPQQTLADQRIARQGELMNQYLGGVQGEATKVQADWYPKEAKARIDQINDQITRNKAILAQGGVSPEDMLKLAQIDKINMELSTKRISVLEDALKLSDKMDKKSRKLLALEYIMAKYPILAERPPKELLEYLDTNKVDIFGIKFDRIYPEITPEDVALVANRVKGLSPIPQTGGSNMAEIKQEYNQNNAIPVTPIAPGTNPITSQLLNMQNSLLKSGMIK